MAMQEEIRMALIVVQDMTTASMQVSRMSVSLASTATVSMLLDQVANFSSYTAGSFELILQRAANTDNNVRWNLSLKTKSFDQNGNRGKNWW